MKVYVASKFERKEEVRAIHQLLRASGHEITEDWTASSGAGGLSGRVLITKLRHDAIVDMEGVLASDALVLLHDDNCRGGFAEFGMALASGKLVLVVNGRSRGHNFPIFYFDPDVHHFDTAEAAVRFLDWSEKAWKMQ